MKKSKYQYNDDIKYKILNFRDVISIKEFYWNACNTKDTKNMYLLTCPLCGLEMRASTNYDEYVDIFRFKINYTHNDERVDFHGWSITQAKITLIGFEHATDYESDFDNSKYYK